MWLDAPAHRPQSSTTRPPSRPVGLRVFAHHRRPPPLILSRRSTSGVYYSLLQPTSNSLQQPTTAYYSLQQPTTDGPRLRHSRHQLQYSHPRLQYSRPRLHWQHSLVYLLSPYSALRRTPLFARCFILRCLPLYPTLRCPCSSRFLIVAVSALALDSPQLPTPSDWFRLRV